MGICQIKVQFVRDKVKDFMEIDPYLDLKSVVRVREMLCEAGFYKKIASIPVIDQAVVNIIIAAQGKKQTRFNAARKLERYDY